MQKRIADDQNSPAWTWTVAGASVTGTKHALNQEGCQDYTRYRLLTGQEQDDWALIATVADGAGSAKAGALGAQLASTASLEYLARILSNDQRRREATDLALLAKTAATRARYAVQSAALRHEHPISEYATTLLITVTTQHGIGAAQIGDGAIVCGHGKGQYKMLTTPYHGDYANETRFLTSKDGLQRMNVAHDAVPPTRLAIFTDGVENLLTERSGSHHAPHIPFFDTAFEWLAEQPDEWNAYVGIRQFLKSEAVTARTNDDTTVFLALTTCG